MDTIRNLLVAVPASAVYQPTVEYAIPMAQDLHVRLTIALVYTCNLALKGEKAQDMKGLVRQKEYVRESFEQWRATLQEAALEFRLVSVDGPLCEAILALAPTYQPDLIISAADPDLPLPHLIQTIPHHLLLVPLSARYSHIRHLRLAYDATPLPSPEPVHFINQLAKAYGANVEVVEVVEPDRAKVPLFPSTLRANIELDFLFKDVAHRFHFASGGGDPIESIEHYTQQYPTDILVMLAYRQLPFQVPSADRHTVSAAKHTSIPLLILKK